MKGNPAVPGGSLTSKPTWSNTFRVFHHVGFFWGRDGATSWGCFGPHMGISTMLVERRSATMTSHKSPGLLHRMLIALGHGLKRGILGKSSHDYMKQFSGRDDYWDRVIAAQLGWPEKQAPKPDPNAIRSAGNAIAHARPGARRKAACLPQPHNEPVHGWTKRQGDDYLARNPGYRMTYEAELQKRCSAGVPGVNGASFDWRINRDKAASNTEPSGTKQARESQTDPLCGL
jgi:hypothetical protein